jgi:hypothetical protein
MVENSNQRKSEVLDVLEAIIHWQRYPSHDLTSKKRTKCSHKISIGGTPLPKTRHNIILPKK